MNVLNWLLDSDPAIRWQVLHAIVHAPAQTIAAERARTVTEGWGARLLALQNDDGQWAGGACFPANSSNWRQENKGQPWISTLPTLQLLVDLGIDPRSGQVQDAVQRAKEGCRWEHAEQPFSSGEVEPCINGRVVTIGGYFGENMDALVERLLSEQLEDGGWNCEAPKSRRSSFHTTLCVLEGLLAYERAGRQSAAISEARQRAENYLLERRMFRSLRTGQIIDKRWLRLTYPTHWHYDVLRGLDYLRDAGVPPDSRMEEAIQIVIERRHQNGRWPLNLIHPEKIPLEMETRVGSASRWNTLRALRVLRWYGESLGS